METIEFLDLDCVWLKSRAAELPDTRSVGSRVAAFLGFLVLVNLMALAAGTAARGERPERRTEISIEGAGFRIDGRPTYQDRIWKGHKIEGLLFNSRMVQGIFDDRNPSTVERWAYPDTGEWDPERNTREFVEAMPAWRRHGLLAFTINLQGGSPEGYSLRQPWHNSGIDPDGSLRLRPAPLQHAGRD
jgi:hypothetical protein